MNEFAKMLANFQQLPTKKQLEFMEHYSALKHEFKVLREENEILREEHQQLGRTSQ